MLSGLVTLGQKKSAGSNSQGVGMLSSENASPALDLGRVNPARDERMPHDRFALRTRDPNGPASAAKVLIES